MDNFVGVEWAWVEREREGTREKSKGTLDWAWKRENPDGNSRMKSGYLENGQKKASPVSIPVPAISPLFSIPIFFCLNGIQSVYAGYGAGQDGIFPSHFHAY